MHATLSPMHRSLSSMRRASICSLLDRPLQAITLTRSQDFLPGTFGLADMHIPWTDGS